VPDLRFAIEGAEPVLFAAMPQLAFTLRVDNRPPAEAVESIALRCQIRLDATRRHYSAAEQRRLTELWGEPERWSQTLRSLLWTHVQLVVPRFTGETVAPLYVPCTFDFNVAATKYFAGLESGELPLEFLFSGTAFYRDGGGALQVTQIPWEKEARFRLPVQAWTAMMDHYYPDSGWLCLRRDLLGKLAEYKRLRGRATWDEALETLLADATSGVPR
jgi:hypothetical protein